MSISISKKCTRIRALAAKVALLCNNSIWSNASIVQIYFLSFTCLGRFLQILSPVDTGRKLNVHKTFRRGPGRLLNVLCTFSLRLVSTRLTISNDRELNWSLGIRFERLNSSLWLPKNVTYIMFIMVTISKVG